jgi:hypothetical protein
MSSFITISNIENNDGCIPPLNFKPGSIGEKVSFAKTPSTPVDVIVPGMLGITRDIGGYGIYNISAETGYNTGSPQFTRWNTQYVDPDDTNWASLTDIQNRTYLHWITAITTPSGGQTPAMYVGMRSIMKYEEPIVGGIVKYYLIIFTAWNSSTDYFAYDRYEILDGVYVEQLSSDNPSAPQFIDDISTGVKLVRKYQGGALYNTVHELNFQQGVSPFNTRWNSIFTDTRPGHSGFTNLTNLESRVYTDFASALDGEIGINIPGTDLIMHDLTTDVYHKIDFSAWAQGCGGLGYTQYNSQYGNPTGYPIGVSYVTATGGSGSGLVMAIDTDSSGNMISTTIVQNGTGYNVNDNLFFPGGNLQIYITVRCYQGGFAYTRTPIPQSCGIKFADGTVINSANSLGGVQSVTGLNTNNADPLNPVIRVSVDGTTITGLGTPASPLVAVATCKPEFIKIASHSCNLLPGIIQNPELVVSFGGYPLNNTNHYGIWSTELNNYAFDFATPSIKNNEKALGIACPTNLVKSDVLTISGTAYFNNANTYSNAGYDVSFIIAVSEFDCTKPDIDSYPSFTLIPLQNYSFGEDGSVCFSAQVTLAKNYDLHSTRFLVGAGATAICPDGLACIYPIYDDENLISLSYTLDVERPCAAGADNYIIRNCCEPIITELVYAPEGLEIDSFISDDEGNCWEVISGSNDVTNFTRNFVNNYASCAACQDANECPANLVISSCCVVGAENVTGSLPGLAVGDTFVDNNGLCWTVDGETPAPISEESITVVEIIDGDCVICEGLHPCPTFWVIDSCCIQKLPAIISTTTALNPGDTFVDQLGRCWGVRFVAQDLPTDYTIEVVTVYPGSILDGCEDCKTANPCPTEYFLTIRACCDTDRVEVTLIPAAFINFGEGDVISDKWKLCWEIMSISTVGTETYQIYDWSNSFSVPRYKNCDDCVKQVGNKGNCMMIYEVISCSTGMTSIVYAAFESFIPPVFGQYYIDQNTDSCFQIIGYATGEPVGTIRLFPYVSAATCELCSLYRKGPKTVDLQSCCDGSAVTAVVNGGFFNGIGGSYYLSDITPGPLSSCYTLLGLSTNLTSNVFEVYDGYASCTPCLEDWDPC